MSTRLWTYTAHMLAIGMAISLSACGDSPKQTKDTARKIVVASEASFPPMEFIDDKGQIIGFDIDLVGSIALQAGIDVEIRNVAWDGIFGALKAGEADVIASSVTITDERKAQFDFTKPYYKAGQSLMTRTGDKEKYPTLESLKGKKVGVQMGTTAAEHMQKLGGYELKQYNTAGMAIIDLANGQVEAALIDKPVADYHASKKPEFKEKVVVVGQLQTSEEFGFVVRKGETELVNKLNAALEQLQKNGTVQRLEEKWFR